MLLQVPSILGTYPRVERWGLGMGGDRMGHVVWPLDSSSAMVADMASG